MGEQKPKIIMRSPWTAINSLMFVCIGIVFLHGFTFYGGTEILTDSDDLTQIRPNTYMAGTMFVLAIMNMMPYSGVRLLAKVVFGILKLPWRYLVSKDKKKRVKDWWIRQDSDNLYYIRDTRGYCGNSLMWWREGGGYSPDINQAERFTREEAERICRNRDTDKMYSVPEMNAIAQRHIDVQDLPVNAETVTSY